MKEDKSVDGLNMGSSLPGGIAWIRYSDGEIFKGPMYGLPDRRRYFDVWREVKNPEIQAEILAIRARTSLILDRVAQINKAIKDREKIIH